MTTETITQPINTLSIEKAPLDALLALFKQENDKRCTLADKIHVNLENMSRDESLELVDQWEVLDDDCHAIAMEISERLTNINHKQYKEIDYV